MVHVYFSDVFDVDPEAIEDYGAFNISLVTDLPLFIDPFLLFHSEKPEYQILHEAMIRYLRFICDRSKESPLDDDRIRNWLRFPEVKQTWLGFSESGNSGRGLGSKFATALAASFDALFSDFGSEKITKGSHLEKLCLLRGGVGRDTISDFTTNLIKDYLLTYTETFAKQYIAPEYLKEFPVQRAVFNYATRAWQMKRYTLPVLDGEFVLLTPKDILAKDDTWICKSDFYDSFDDLPTAIGNDQLRAQINEYFLARLPKTPKGPSVKERHAAMLATVHQFPELYDWYIRQKEDTGDQARNQRIEEVREVFGMFVTQAKQLIAKLEATTEFYRIRPTTIADARRRVEFLKDAIENKGCWKIFYNPASNKPIRKEEDLQILYRLTWLGSANDVSREVNDGRGPVDFKVSHGAIDKTLVEMKLASNSKLKQNLEKQTDIYQKASDASHALKVIIFFSQSEEGTARSVLKELKLDTDDKIYLIDARSDNKPSGSNA